MRSMIEELQNREKSPGEKLYQFNIYDNKDVLAKKWKNEYKSLLSSREEVGKSVTAVSQMFRLVENVNRNILVHALLEKDFAKEIESDRNGDYIHYYLPNKRRFNHFNDCDMYKGFAYLYTGLTNLNLVQTRHDYFDESRDLFRNIEAHSTKTMFFDSYGKRNVDVHSELVRIFNQLTEYLVINNLLDSQLVENALDDMLVKPGELLQNGNYKVERLISDKGGSSLVYLGKQCKLKDRVVAIKEYRRNVFEKKEQYESVLNSEISNLVELSEGNRFIPNIIDRFYENGTHYIVMEYVPGINALEYFAKHSLPYDQVVNILKQLAEILLYLNQKKVAYNDLKSENILITNEQKVYLIDLATEGIAADTKAGVFRKEIIEYGKLIEKLLQKTKLKSNETEFLLTLSNHCIKDDKYQSVEEILGYLNKNVIKETVSTKVRTVWYNKKKRAAIFVGLAVIIAAIGLGIYYFAGPPSYVRLISKNTVGIVIDDYKKKPNNSLELDFAVVNRKWDYIKKGDVVHVVLGFEVDGVDDTKKLEYSFTVSENIGHDKVKKYTCELSKKNFPKDEHSDIILGGFESIEIKKITVDYKSE